MGKRDKYPIPLNLFKKRKAKLSLDSQNYRIFFQKIESIFKEKGRNTTPFPNHLNLNKILFQTLSIKRIFRSFIRLTYSMDLSNVLVKIKFLSLMQNLAKLPIELLNEIFSNLNNLNQAYRLMKGFIKYINIENIGQKRAIISEFRTLSTISAIFNLAHKMQLDLSNINLDSKSNQIQFYLDFHNIQHLNLNIPLTIKDYDKLGSLKSFTNTNSYFENLYDSLSNLIFFITGKKEIPNTILDKFKENLPSPIEQKQDYLSLPKMPWNETNTTNIINYHYLLKILNFLPNKYLPELTKYFIEFIDKFYRYYKREEPRILLHFRDLIENLKIAEESAEDIKILFAKMFATDLLGEEHLIDTTFLEILNQAGLLNIDFINIVLDYLIKIGEILINGRPRFSNIKKPLIYSNQIDPKPKKPIEEHILGMYELYIIPNQLKEFIQLLKFLIRLNLSEQEIKDYIHSQVISLYFSIEPDIKRKSVLDLFIKDHNRKLDHTILKLSKLRKINSPTSIDFFKNSKNIHLLKNNFSQEITKTLNTKPSELKL